VDYRNMGPEELGSVYESLLELVPTIDLPARRFGFVGRPGRQHRRQRPQTHRQLLHPDSLVQELIKSALDPSSSSAWRPRQPHRALLAIRVIDPPAAAATFCWPPPAAWPKSWPNCAARRRAGRCRHPPQDYRHALREVVARCIFGVDRNPMAIELARTACGWKASKKAARWAFWTTTCKWATPCWA
jgi:hypothetical protein